MIVSVMQPGYLPWLGFFELMASVDCFVIYDDVDYDKESWRNRNRIKTPRGPLWISVPVITKGRFGQAISEVEIAAQHNWQESHLKTLRQYYSKAPYYREFLPFFEELYSRQWRLLVDLDMAVIEHCRSVLGVTTPLVLSSRLRSQGKKTDRLVALCQELGADTYISSNGAKGYLQVECFRAEGIDVRFQNYDHPVYPQLFGDFVSHLSVVDLLFNCGDRSLDVIMSGSTARVQRVVS